MNFRVLILSAFIALLGLGVKVYTQKSKTVAVFDDEETAPTPKKIQKKKISASKREPSSILPDQKLNEGSSIVASDRDDNNFKAGEV